VWVGPNPRSLNLRRKVRWLPAAAGEYCIFAFSEGGAKQPDTLLSIVGAAVTGGYGVFAQWTPCPARHIFHYRMYTLPIRMGGPPRKRNLRLRMGTGKTVADTGDGADSNKKTVGILLVDAQPIVRMGLRMLIAVSWKLRVVAEVGTCREALERCRSQPPDMLVVDPALPDVAVPEMMARIQDYPRIPCLVLSTQGDEWNVLAALRAGVRGYVTKSARPEIILQAIRAVADGERFLDRAVAHLVMDHLGTAIKPGRHPGSACTLTNREWDVLKLLAQGRRNRDISQTLHISERTVKFHTTALFQKLEAGNRTEAVRKAINFGLVHP